jgi:hypothetical protein
VLLWVAAIMEDLRSGLFAGILLIACAPLYAWIARRRRHKVSAIPKPAPP